MLAESTLPTVRYDVPIQPRVTPRPSPRFASEPEAEQVNEVAEEKIVSSGHGAPRS